MRLAAGLRWGSLQSSPRPGSWIIRVRTGKGRERKGGGERTWRKGRGKRERKEQGRTTPNKKSCMVTGVNFVRVRGLVFVIFDFENAATLKPGYGSVKVIENVAIR